MTCSHRLPDSRCHLRQQQVHLASQVLLVVLVVVVAVATPRQPLVVALAVAAAGPTRMILPRHSSSLRHSSTHTWLLLLASILTVWLE